LYGHDVGRHAHYERQRYFSYFVKLTLSEHRITIFVNEIEKCFVTPTYFDHSPWVHERCRDTFVALITEGKRRTLTQGERTRLVAEFVIKSVAELPSEKHFTDDALERVAEYRSGLRFFQ